MRARAQLSATVFVVFLLDTIRVTATAFHLPGPTGTIAPIQRRNPFDLHRIPAAELLLSEIARQHWTVWGNAETGDFQLATGNWFDSIGIDSHDSTDVVGEAAKKVVERILPLLQPETVTSKLPFPFQVHRVRKFRNGDLWVADFFQVHHERAVVGTNLSIRFLHGEVVQIQSQLRRDLFCEGRCQMEAQSRKPGPNRRAPPNRDHYRIRGLTKPHSGAEGEAPAALPLEGAARAPINDERNVYYHLALARDRVAETGFEAKWLRHRVPVILHSESFPPKPASSSAGQVPGGPCSATFDGALNFFGPGSIIFGNQFRMCRSTWKIPSVIYHEWFHGLFEEFIGHKFAQDDRASSEAFCDAGAFHMTGRPEIGFGIFEGILEEKNFLRSARGRDENGDPLSYPTDLPWNGDPQTEGLILAGAFWDLRDYFINTYGEEEGSRRSFRLLLEAFDLYPYDYTWIYPSLLLAISDDTNSNEENDIRAVRQVFASRCLAFPAENKPECYSLTVKRKAAPTSDTSKS